MGNFNKVLLLGNLCQDPEIKYSAAGNAFCQTGMATNRKWTNRETGELQEEVCFVDVKAFGRTAEIMGEYLQKGSPVFIEGRLSYYRWDDEQGNPHSKHSVVVESLQLLGKNAVAQATDKTADVPASAGLDTEPGEKAEVAEAVETPEGEETTVTEDDIPFS